MAMILFKNAYLKDLSRFSKINMWRIFRTRPRKSSIYSSYYEMNFIEKNKIYYTSLNVKISSLAYAYIFFKISK